MVPTLHIDRFQSGVYTANLEDGGHRVVEEKMFSCVADAIRHFGLDAPDDLIQFIDIKYSDYSIGTISTARMRSEAEALASDLMSLYSAVASAEEEMQSRRQSSKA